MKIKRITIHGKEFFSEVNGNSYHSVRINIDDIIYFVPYQYGYGTAYEQSAVEYLNKKFGLNIKYLNRYCDENNIKLDSFIEKNCKKKDVKLWGERGVIR